MENQVQTTEAALSKEVSGADLLSAAENLALAVEAMDSNSEIQFGVKIISDKDIENVFNMLAEYRKVAPANKE